MTGAPSRASARAGDVTLARREYEDLRADEREHLLNEAVASQRIAPGRRAHWRAALERDHDGAKAILQDLAPGLPPEPVDPAAAEREEEQALAAARSSFGLPD